MDSIQNVNNVHAHVPAKAETDNARLNYLNLLKCLQLNDKNHIYASYSN